MASDIKTTSDDADMAECDGEKVVTMMDVLQEQEDFEEDANAVLGASDDKECTYSKGYIKRQALYACMTCCPEAKSDPTKRAGVCLACSLMCHENHELVELYTKRNFRCDCGNPKFSSHPCTFTPNKTELNEDNYYNQNFSGLYCTCQRPYPDPESTVEDLMIQCIICEDWLHASHLESTVPANDQYSEMICKTCMEKNEFLHDYSELAINIESVDVDVLNISGSDAHNPKLCNGDAKTEAIDSTLSQNVTKPDLEVTEEKLEESVTATDTSVQESEEGKENEAASKDDSDINDKKEDESMETNEPVSKDDNDINDKEVNSMETNEAVSKNDSDINDKKEDDSMETNESEQVQPSDATSEETTANVTQEPSTDKSEQDTNTESETKTDAISNTDDISKDVSDESTADKSEDNSDKATPVNQSEDNDKEQASGEETNNKPEEDSPMEDAEKPKMETEEHEKANEQNAEKMEEDKLLADPEDSQNAKSIEDNKNSTDNNITGTDAVTNEKEAKPEIEPNSDINEKSNSSDDKLDSGEVSKSTLQNESDSNIEKISETNTSTNNDNSSENKIQSESVSEEDKNDVEPTNQNETTNESNNSDKIPEKRKIEEENSDSKEAKKPKLNDIACARPKEVKKMYNGATFWPSNFRQMLCTCQECITMYNDLSVLYLIDPEDTVIAYEKLGKQKINGKPTTQYEKGLQALSSLDRIQQINALTEYNKMRDKLLVFLKSFKDRKEIVKEEDIKAFFAGMRPKREPDGVYFCR